MKPEKPIRPGGRPPFHRLLTETASHAAALDALADITKGPEENLDLGLAALVIAVDHYPHLDVAAYLRRLDNMAHQARKRLSPTHTPEQSIAALNAYLFEEQGFRGNAEDYYNPANSFLNEVLDTCSGLPITLSIVYIALAQRLGLPVRGVGLPLHFIVRYDAPDADTDDPVSVLNGILIDPFHRGEILTPRACQERIERIMGHPIAFDPAYLQPTPNRLILYRLLNNLKQVYMRREEPERAGRVVEQMLIVAPDSADDIRDRGLLFLQEGAFSKAVDWLTRYLASVPDADDAEGIQRAIEQAYHLRAQFN